MDFKAVILDLGGVLINIDYTRTIKAFEALGDEHFQEAYSQAAQSGLFDDFETGRISASRFVNSLLPSLKQGTTPNKVVHAWNAMLLDVPEEKIKLLDRIRQKYPLFLLSNTNELHVPLVRRRWAEVTDRPMEDFFNKLYFSHEVNMRKPHREIFELVCQEQQLVPGETLFVDDSIQHVTGAQEAGLQAIHLQNPDDLFQLFS